MWIKMLIDQVGPDGVFLKGQTIPLPLKIVEKLDSASYVQVDVDDQAMEQMGIAERLRHLNAELATIDAAIKPAKARLADLHKKRRALYTKIKQADDELEQIKQARTKAEMEAKDGPESEKPADESETKDGPESEKPTDESEAKDGPEGEKPTDESIDQ